MLDLKVLQEEDEKALQGQIVDNIYTSAIADNDYEGQSDDDKDDDNCYFLDGTCVADKEVVVDFKETKDPVIEKKTQTKEEEKEEEEEEEQQNDTADTPVESNKTSILNTTITSSTSTFTEANSSNTDNLQDNTPTPDWLAAEIEYTSKLLSQQQVNKEESSDGSSIDEEEEKERELLKAVKNGQMKDDEIKEIEGVLYRKVAHMEQRCGLVRDTVQDRSPTSQGRGEEPKREEGGRGGGQRQAMANRQWHEFINSNTNNNSSSSGSSSPTTSPLRTPSYKVVLKLKDHPPVKLIANWFFKLCIMTACRGGESTMRYMDMEWKRRPFYGCLRKYLLAHWMYDLNRLDFCQLSIIGHLMLCGVSNEYSQFPIEDFRKRLKAQNVFEADLRTCGLGKHEKDITMATFGSAAISNRSATENKNAKVCALIVCHLMIVCLKGKKNYPNLDYLNENVKYLTPEQKEKLVRCAH